MKKMNFIDSKVDSRSIPFGSILEETREKTVVENEDTLLSCAIGGIYRNDELFSHFRGKSNVGYIKIKKNDLILSAQNLHLGNANVNLRFEHGIISPAYKVYKIIGADPAYIAQWVKMPQTNQFFLEATTEGASQCRKNIEWDTLYAQNIQLPSNDVQRKIAKLLSLVDTKIRHEKSNVEKMKDLKSSMLVKMFPKEGKHVPEIRFEGYTNPWEQRKLGEVGQTYTGLSGKTKEDFGHGRGKFVTYMNVFTNVVSNPQMIEPIEIDQKQNNVQSGDVLFTTSSETPEEVGMSSVWLGNEENTYLNSFCFGYRLSINIDPYYLAYMLRSSIVRKRIVLLAQGFSRYNISKNKVMEITVPLPSLAEQHRLGWFFKNLDSLITLHQRKYEKLLDLKKAFLNKMIGDEN